MIHKKLDGTTRYKLALIFIYGAGGCAETRNDQDAVSVEMKAAYVINFELRGTSFTQFAKNFKDVRSDAAWEQLFFTISREKMAALFQNQQLSAEHLPPVVETGQALTQIGALVCHIKFPSGKPHSRIAQHDTTHWCFKVKLMESLEAHAATAARVGLEEADRLTQAYIRSLPERTTHPRSLYSTEAEEIKAMLEDDDICSSVLNES